MKLRRRLHDTESKVRSLDSVFQSTGSPLVASTLRTDHRGGRKRRGQQGVFGRGFGRASNPDSGLMLRVLAAGGLTRRRWTDRWWRWRPRSSGEGFRPVIGEFRGGGRILESSLSLSLDVGDRFRNLRIVLKQERKEYVIEEPVPDELAANASRADKDKFKKHMDDMLDVNCLMLVTMSPELQKQHEDMIAYDMIQNLKEIYEGQARQERYETSKALFQCKMSEGSPVGAHVIKMMGYIQTLEKLGFPLKNELATDLKEKERKKAKSKGIGKSKPKGKDALKPEKGISKDGKCFHCDKSEHWKRNCPLFLEEVKKENGASSSGINEPLKRRILAKGNVDLRAGNGARVAALAIGTNISLAELL
ncbi:hypothetical protein V6N13_028404 [Hibiscus sabdariffa]